MIKPITNLPPNVIGFEAVGDVTGDEYRAVLEPAVEAASDGGTKLRALFVLGPQFEGFKSGAMLEDAKLGLATWSAWERIAVVTDRRAISETIDLLGWIVPGEVRSFDIDALGDAVLWLSEL